MGVTVLVVNFYGLNQFVLTDSSNWWFHQPIYVKSPKHLRNEMQSATKTVTANQYGSSPKIFFLDAMNLKIQKEYLEHISITRDELL